MRSILVLIIAFFLLVTCQNNNNTDLQNQGTKLKDLGNDHLWINNDSAIYYYGKALQIFKNLNDTANLGKAYHNIGICYDNKNQYDSSLFYYQKGLMSQV